MNGRFIIFWIALALVLAVSVTVGACGASDSESENQGQGQRKTLVRNGPYYEITGDGDDFGNFFETYSVPTPKGDVYCIVYSDKIGDGGGAGLDCNWEEVNR